MRNCEEYVLNELEKIKKENEDLKKEITKLNNKEEDIENDKKCIYLSDKPYYYYSLKTTSAYNWNKTLIKNNKNPEFIEEALKDDKKLKELCELKVNEYYGNRKMFYISENIYNYLFTARNGKKIAIILNDENLSDVYIGKKYNSYLTKEEAEKGLKEIVKEGAEEYIEYYKKKYEEELKKFKEEVK